MKTFLILYIPVLHQGYLNLFEKYHKKTDGLLLLGNSLIEENKLLTKEIRAMEPSTVAKLIISTGVFKEVGILEEPLQFLKECRIITTSEEITKRFAEKYLAENEITWDSSFLRWDEGHVISRTDVKFDRESSEKFDQQVMKEAIEEGKKSPDWWRQVGAVLVKNGKKILQSYNHDSISEYRPYAFGNIRDYVKAGEKSEITPTIHAEQSIIAEAAKRGISLEGSHIYVSVFPCTTCAGIIVASGIKKCFFATGNAYFDVENILKAKGVELIFVK